MDNDIDLELTTKQQLTISGKKNTEWKSCCFKMNTNATKYFIQTGILSGLILYSSIMLVVDTSCESQRNYSSLLMVCLGCFLPSPKIN